MIGKTLKCYIELWRYKLYFRNVAKNIAPNATDHVRQLNATVNQVGQMMAEASVQAENATRLYEETRKEFMSQDMRYPDIENKKMSSVEYKYEYQLKRLHKMEELHEAFIEYRDRAMAVCK